MAGCIHESLFVMTWARDLSHDAAYSLHYPRCDLILTKPTNSAHLFKRYYPQTYEARVLRPTGLKPTRTASSLPPLNITSFDLATSWSVRRSEVESRRSEVRSGGWKNNRRENPIAFSIAFSLTMNEDLCLTCTEIRWLKHFPHSTSAQFTWLRTWLDFFRSRWASHRASLVAIGIGY